MAPAAEFAPVSLLISEAIAAHQLPRAVVHIGHGGKVVFRQTFGSRKLAGEPGLDGNSRLELFEYIHPEAIESKPTIANQIGMHRVAFSVDDIDKALEMAARHGCRPLCGVATLEDVSFTSSRTSAVPAASS